MEHKKMSYEEQVMEKAEYISTLALGTDYDKLDNHRKDLVFELAEMEVADDIADYGDMLLDMWKDEQWE